MAQFLKIWFWIWLYRMNVSNFFFNLCIIVAIHYFEICQNLSRQDGSLSTKKAVK